MNFHWSLTSHDQRHIPRRTEQLAIESGQRVFTHSAAQGDYILKTTAYLLHNTAMLADSSYLSQDKAYEHMAYGLNKDRWTSKKPIPDAQSYADELGRAATSAPVAAIIRYKVYAKDKSSADGRYNKLFEHTFDAQSEFFDANQYRLLNLWVRACLMGGTNFYEWYAEKVAELEQGS